MQKTFIARGLAAAAFALAAAHAQAGDFGFAGNIVMNTDLVNVDFSVTGTGGVSLWTDSFQSGLNFDPQLTLWQQVGSDFRLVTSNDDNNAVAPAQGYQDAGIATTLAAGTYKLTLSASSYQAVGTQLSQGFRFDPFFVPALTAAPIASWNQPSYDPDLNNQKGTAWSIHLSGTGIGSATVAAVPEPESLVLMLAGLVAVAVPAAWKSRRRPPCRDRAVG